MAGDVFPVGEKNHPLAVGRNVGKPVVEFVEGNLFLSAAISLHAPDLHVAGAFGVEVNVFAVGRIFGAVVEAGSGGEASLAAAGDRDGIDVELAIALADESQRLPVRRPAVPIRGKIGREGGSRAAADRNDVDA